jgi:hypothetical protein
MIGIISFRPGDYNRDEIEKSIQETLDELRAEYARLGTPKNKLSEKNRRAWK